MYLLSIQGRYAPAFQLKYAAALQLRQQIEAVTNKHTQIISSKFRSDLIYDDDINRLEEFLEIWSDSVGYPYDNSLKLKFFRSAEEAVSISQFFYRLHLLRRFPKWYDGYLENLLNVLDQKTHCPLCQKLSEAMEQFCEAVEVRRLKRNHETLIKSVHEFVKLKHLASLHKRNDN